MKIKKANKQRLIKELEGKKRFIQNNIDFNASWLCQAMQLEKIKEINAEIKRLKGE